jgi:hypothetical protein
MPITSQFTRVLFPGLAQDRDLSRGRREQAFKDFDGSGLSRPVRSQQAKTLARCDFEIQAPHGLHLAVVGLAQVAALDSGGHD